MAIIRLQGEREQKRGIHYELDTASEPIGVGGMGQVFRGISVDERTGSTRPVAIKFMFEDLPPQAIERARREASIMLKNDNLIEMLGFLETQEIGPDGGVRKHYHVVSELLDGVSLSDLLEGKTKNREGQDVPYAVKLLQDYRNDPEHFARTVVMSVLSGLMSLHDAGYIHRDIDPSNIFVTSDEHIKLIDFGIAKQMNDLTTSDKSLTVAGKFMGKPEYAAPELALGDVKHQNQTTDIYAVGILLYQCILGHTPFEGPRHEILEKQIKEKVPVKNIKDKNLRAIIATACEKKQELRYQSSAQMRVALEEMSGVKKAMSAKTKGMIAGGAAAVILILLIVFLVVSHRHSQAQQQAQEAEQAKQEAAFEQKKNDFVVSIQNRILQAKNMSGNVGDDDVAYETGYMNTFGVLKQIEQELKNDTVFKVDINEELPEIGKLKTEVMDTLRSAKDKFEKNKESMLALDQAEAAADYQKRIEKIDSFINNNK